MPLAIDRLAELVRSGEFRLRRDHDDERRGTVFWMEIRPYDERRQRFGMQTMMSDMAMAQGQVDFDPLVIERMLIESSEPRELPHR
jgi:hypothetical protein